MLTPSFQFYTPNIKMPAIQYTGTQANAEEILQFLYARNINAEVQTIKNTTLKAGKPINTFVKSISIERVGFMLQFDYLILDPEGQLQITTNDDFAKEFDMAMAPPGGWDL